jgi:sodium transport system permease protein
MRLKIVNQVFLKELRETLRDRRSLAVWFVLPLVLYPAAGILTAGLGTSRVQQFRQTPPREARLVVVNAGDAPHLLPQLKHPRSGFQIVSPADPKAALAARQVEAILVVPSRCEANALKAKETEIRLQMDRRRPGAVSLEARLYRLLGEYDRWIIGERLRARRVPDAIVRPIRKVTDDLGAEERPASGKAGARARPLAGADRVAGGGLAGAVAMLLLMMGGLGAFYPAVNATTMERELGTLESLLVTPASKLELLVGKAGLVLLSSLLTAALNLISLALVVGSVSLMLLKGVPPAQAPQPGGPELSLLRNAFLTYLATVPTLIFLAAALLVVALSTRNFREASAYSTPVWLLSVVPMFVAIADPKTTPGLLVMPIVNTTLVIRDAFTGDVTAGAFMLAFASSFLYAGLMLSLAARLFSSEDLVNPAWEPLSLRGFRQDSRARQRRVPAVDEALTLFALTLLLLFYVTPLWMGRGLLPLLAGSELLLTAAPALLFAWLCRYNWVATFSWRPPRAAWMLGAGLVGLAAVPWIHALAGLQERVWPQNPDAARVMNDLIRAPLERYPLLTVAAVGLLPGVCEELLYRGPIQTALARRLPARWALGIGAFLFAVAHMDPHGFLPRAILGFVFGWIVLRGGSIFPAMLAHGVYDAATLTFAHWGRPGSPFDLNLSAPPGPHALLPLSIQLAASAGLLLVGWRLCVQARPPRPSPNP